jgi:hypothetical protein
MRGVYSGCGWTAIFIRKHGGSVCLGLSYFRYGNLYLLQRAFNPTSISAYAACIFGNGNAQPRGRDNL